jgi:hypothetical protein
MPRYYSFFLNKFYIYKPSHLQIYILMTIYITQLIYNIYILITILLWGIFLFFSLAFAANPRVEANFSTSSLIVE